MAYSDVVTTGCSGTKVIARTWTATDVCGNSADAIQTITVRDTKPPIITAPADIFLECPADTTPGNTGTATAVDGFKTGKITTSQLGWRHDVMIGEERSS